MKWVRTRDEWRSGVQQPKRAMICASCRAVVVGRARRPEGVGRRLVNAKTYDHVGVRHAVELVALQRAPRRTLGEVRLYKVGMAIHATR